MEQNEKRKFLDKLKFRYRVVVINDETFIEKGSFTLSLMNLIVFIGSVSLFMIFLLIYIIAFTSLREYIPGYADINTRRNITKVALRSDSLLNASAEKDLYIANLQNIISGKVTEQDIKNTVSKKSIIVDTSKLYASEAEKEFRTEMQNTDKNSLTHGSAPLSGISSFFFFPPIQGVVTNKFKATPSHYGADIVSKPNEAIKSTLSGTVIFAGWTSETGFVIEVQHEQDIISVYKHNSVLLKKMGEKVKAGDPIAIIGNSGENSTGPHLHFELWYKGTSIDPQEYIKF